MVLSMNAVPRSSRHSSAATVVDPNFTCALARGVFRRQTLIDQLHRLAFNVKGQLVVKVALNAAGPEQRAKS